MSPGYKASDDDLFDWYEVLLTGSDPDSLLLAAELREELIERGVLTDEEETNDSL